MISVKEKFFPMVIFMLMLSGEGGLGFFWRGVLSVESFYMLIRIDANIILFPLLKEVGIFYTVIIKRRIHEH